MGLDTIEVVLCVEEVFGLSLPDDECGRIVTVGDLYRLVLSKLGLPYMKPSKIESSGSGRNREIRSMPGLTP
jgi:hypothetical protein